MRLAIDAFDGKAQIVDVEICAALRGREVGKFGELLHHDDGWRPVPEQLGHEEVQIVAFRLKVTMGCDSVASRDCAWAAEMMLTFERRSSPWVE